MSDKKAMNPYLAGALTGLLAVASAWITGKFFGASTTFVRAAGFIEKLFAPEKVAGMAYFIKEAPKIDWQWMFVCGILVGALISALAFGELRLKWVPDTWEKRFGKQALKRGIFAFLGGFIAIMGARLADGCPSGHGLSGLMQLAVSGFVALFFFFVGGVLVAHILYKEGRSR